MTRRLRTTVLLSGTGRSLENLLRVQGDGGLAGIELGPVISSRAGVRGLEIAESAHLETHVVQRREYQDTGSFSEALTDVLLGGSPDIVLMAGFLSLYLLPDELIGKVVNIHPSLLPLFGGKGFYGHHVHAAVIDSGMRVSGCTVHFVDNQYDHGPVILQLPCPVLPEDNADALAARVFEQECLALPLALDWLSSGRAVYQDGIVRYDGVGSWFRA